MKLDNYRVDPSGPVTVESCLMTLDGSCDGAMSKDGVGFNKGDSYHGKYLAWAVNAGHPLSWEEVQDNALHYLRKYQRQLGGKDFMDEFMKCPVFMREPTGSKMTYVLPTRFIKLTESGKGVIFEFKYDETLKDIVKATFRSASVGWIAISPSNPADKAWIANRLQINMDVLKTFANEHDFIIDPAVLEPYVTPSPAATPVQTPAPVVANPNIVEAEDKNIILKFPYSQAIVDDIKASFTKENRSFDKMKPRWIIPVSEDNAVAVVQLANRHGFDICERVQTYYNRVMAKRQQITQAMNGYDVAMVDNKIAIDVSAMTPEVRRQFEELVR